MAGFKKKAKREMPEMNTSSLPDLIFTILFFFMIVTTMREVTLKVKFVVPQGTELEKLEKKSAVSFIYVGPPTDQLRAQMGSGTRIQLNDRYAEPREVMDFVAQERQGMTNQAEQTISIKADQHTQCAIKAAQKWHFVEIGKHGYQEGQHHTAQNKRGKKQHNGNQRHHQRRDDLFHHLLSHVRSLAVQNAFRTFHDAIHQGLRNQALQSAKDAFQVKRALLKRLCGLIHQTGFEKVFKNSGGHFSGHKPRQRNGRQIPHQVNDSGHKSLAGVVNHCGDDDSDQYNVQNECGCKCHRLFFLSIYEAEAG